MIIFSIYKIVNILMIFIRSLHSKNSALIIILFNFACQKWSHKFHDFFSMGKIKYHSIQITSEQCHCTDIMIYEINEWLYMWTKPHSITCNSLIIIGIVIHVWWCFIFHYKWTNKKKHSTFCINKKQVVKENQWMWCLSTQERTKSW